MNQPVRFLGYSPDGTKQYTGDFEPKSPNRQQRRLYLQKSQRPEYGLSEDMYYYQRVFNKKQNKVVKIFHRI